jgi:hypothetical protein
MVNARKRLVTEYNYYLPLKWSGELMAFICYDKWDAIWEQNEDEYKKVVEAMAILKPTP